MLRNFPLLFWGIFRGWRSIAAGDLELGFAAAARWPRARTAGGGGGGGGERARRVTDLESRLLAKLPQGPYFYLLFGDGRRAARV